MKFQAFPLLTSSPIECLFLNNLLRNLYTLVSFVWTRTICSRMCRKLQCEIMTCNTVRYVFFLSLCCFFSSRSYQAACLCACAVNCYIFINGNKTPRRLAVPVMLQIYTRHIPAPNIYANQANIRLWRGTMHNAHALLVHHLSERECATAVKKYNKIL